MASETINVGKAMRSQAWLKKGKRKKKSFRVSPDAVQQMISYIESGIEINIPQMCELAEKTNHPNTVKECDVIRFFDIISHSVFEKEED